MSESTRALALTLPASGVFPCPEDQTWVCCLNCSVPLELHQPDANQPRRFVGTCAHCGRWYLLDWDPGDANGHMVLLPGADELRAAWEAGGG